MLLTKLKIASAALLVIAVLGAALAGLIYYAPAAEPARASQTVPGKDAKAETPASKPEPKDEVPPWKKEFRKVYSLADGEVLKRIAPPFPDCRLEFLRNFPDGAALAKHPPQFLAFRIHPQWLKGEVHNWGLGQFDASIRTVLRIVVQIPMLEVEGDKAVVDHPVGGDFVFRGEASIEERVAAFNRILHDESKLAIKLTFKEVEREVVVARGALKVATLAGQKKNHVEVFGKEIGKGEAWDSRKDLHGFLIDLGDFLGRRIVNEAKSGIDEVFTYGLSVRQVPQHRRPGELSPDFNPHDVFDPAIEAEDRDPKLVLANVAKQTGLTFTTEKRKVRVLFVEASSK
ncbi:MAG: hypothetical protein L0Y72_13070 [Gemmataceae bacterium]|nr:hypothetical protein [Gemmataceae bacterium]MCI0739969.1 hypothetical protein [Gemmataceae bacterium]